MSTVCRVFLLPSIASHVQLSLRLTKFPRQVFSTSRHHSSPPAADTEFTHARQISSSPSPPPLHRQGLGPFSNCPIRIAVVRNKDSTSPELTFPAFSARRCVIPTKANAAWPTKLTTLPLGRQWRSGRHPVARRGVRRPGRES